MAELLRGRRGDEVPVAELGLAAVLHELLDLHGEPAELVLVLLVQVALELEGPKRSEQMVFKRVKIHVMMFTQPVVC